MFSFVSSFVFSFSFSSFPFSSSDLLLLFPLFLILFLLSSFFSTLYLYSVIHPFKLRIAGLDSKEGQGGGVFVVIMLWGRPNKICLLGGRANRANWWGARKIRHSVSNCVSMITLKMHNFPILNRILLKLSLTCSSQFCASVKNNLISGGLPF